MRLRIAAVLFIFLPALGQCRYAPTAPAHTVLELTDGATGREIDRESLRDGEEVVLTWRNSLFRLMVEEVFTAEGGRLVLRKVTFADPRGIEPPAVRPEDLEDLYHTGGPFKAEGLSKPFTRLVFRIGEIGDPKLRIGKKQFELARLVGFGGSVVLTTRISRTAEFSPRAFEPRRDA